MHRFIALQIVTLFLGVESSIGADIRTYRFIPDGSLPYSAECGECGGSYSGASSDIAGTFTISLDFETSTGQLLDLNDTLVNYFNVLVSPSGLILEPAFPNDPHIIPSYLKLFLPSVAFPPFDGTLEGIHEDFVLSSDEVAFPFEIRVSGTDATFNMTVPIIDYHITVTDAPALQIPEPSSGVFCLLGAAFLSRFKKGRTGQHCNGGMINFHLL